MMKVLVHTKMSEQQLDTLRSVCPELEIVREVDVDRAREELKDAEILCTYKLPGPLEEARKLKWIQLVSAGAEHLFEAGISDDGIANVGMAQVVPDGQDGFLRRFPKERQVA